MSEVALQIGGRTWRVACAPGEEERVQRLGATVADKLASLGSKVTADAQNMLFAALLLADEVLEARDAARSASDEIGATSNGAEPASGNHDQLRERIAELEDELGGMRSSQQGSADELTQALARHDELQSMIVAHESDISSLRTEMFEARKERDAARAAPVPQPGLAVEDATPALERFAEMLEDCADKLERRANAS